MDSCVECGGYLGHSFTCSEGRKAATCKECSEIDGLHRPSCSKANLMLTLDYSALVVDNVNHPSHYADDPSGVECIEITRWMNFDLGNGFKYIFRAGRKDLKGDALKAEIEDLKKAVWYLTDAITHKDVYWPDYHHEYNKQLMKVMNYRDGHILSAMTSIYNNRKEWALTAVLSEIMRLENNEF